MDSQTENVENELARWVRSLDLQVKSRFRYVAHGLRETEEPELTQRAPTIGFRLGLVVGGAAFAVVVYLIGTLLRAHYGVC